MISKLSLDMDDVRHIYVRQPGSQRLQDADCWVYSPDENGKNPPGLWFAVDDYIESQGSRWWLVSSPWPVSCVVLVRGDEEQDGMDAFTNWRRDNSMLSHFATHLPRTANFSSEASIHEVEVSKVVMWGSDRE